MIQRSVSPFAMGLLAILLAEVLIHWISSTDGLSHCLHSPWTNGDEPQKLVVNTQPSLDQFTY